MECGIKMKRNFNITKKNLNYSVDANNVKHYYGSIVISAESVKHATKLWMESYWSNTYTLTSVEALDREKSWLPRHYKLYFRRKRQKLVSFKNI